MAAERSDVALPWSKLYAAISRLSDHQAALMLALGLGRPARGRALAWAARPPLPPALAPALKMVSSPDKAYVSFGHHAGQKSTHAFWQSSTGIPRQGDGEPRTGSRLSCSCSGPTRSHPRGRHQEPPQHPGSSAAQTPSHRKPHTSSEHAETTLRKLTYPARHARRTLAVPQQLPVPETLLQGPSAFHLTPSS